MARLPEPDAADVATLRAVTPPEVPYPGVLVGGAAPHYRVRADDCPVAVWRARPDGHVLGADDVDTDDAGTSIILPRLAGRLDNFVRREDVTGGEAVTIAVSLVRGAAQAIAQDVADGTWWVTRLGRPVLAPGDGEPWRESTRELLNELARAHPGPFAEAAGDALEALGAEHGFVARAAVIEDALFACARAQPVDISRPRAAISGADNVPARVTSAPRARLRRRDQNARAHLWDGIGRLVDAGIARNLSHAVESTRRWIARRIPPTDAERPRARRRMLPLVAGAAVAATLAVGLSWPTAESSTGADRGGGAPAASAGGPDAATPVATAAPSLPVESAPADPRGEAVVDAQVAAPVDLADATLARLTACLAADEHGCLTDVAERPDADFPRGAATNEGERTISLLDDLGGVLVVRVEAVDQPAQIAVIVHADGEGLVRDIYDVADQP